MDFGFGRGRHNPQQCGYGNEGAYGNQGMYGDQAFGSPIGNPLEAPRGGLGGQFGQGIAQGQYIDQQGYGNQWDTGYEQPQNLGYPPQNINYGDQNYGNQQYGNESFGNQSYGNQSCGVQGLGNCGLESQQFGLGAELISPEAILGHLASWFKQDPDIDPKFQIRDKVIQEILYQPQFMQEKQDWDQEKKRNTDSVITEGMNLAAMLTKQVVMIEPSPQEKKVEELRRSGQKYTDQIFPATLKSLTGEHGNVGSWQDINWKKASSIVSKCRLFDDSILPNDIKQGKLGDCYLLAAIAALAEQPQRILNLFLIQKENPEAYYACKIMYKGKWKTIDLDEMIPCTGSQPAFSKAVNQELWVVMLEKAWAKLYASYKRIEAGYPEEGLHDLTGAHIRAIRFKMNFNKEAEWKYFTDATERKFAMIASSQPGSDTNVSTSGIVDGHAYTFLGAYNLSCQGRTERVIKLRNPWGKTESTTKWNDSDPRWNSVSTDQRRRVGFSKQEDGIFFMEYDVFVSNFRMLTIAEVNDNASYIYSTQKSTASAGNYFMVKILKEGSYSFQINQIPERTYPDKDQESHKYADATIKIGKVLGNGKYQEFEGSTSAYRTLFQRHTLTPGDYAVWGKIDFNQKWERDYELTLAIYADYVCEIKDITENECPGFRRSLDRGDIVMSSLIPGGCGSEGRRCKGGRGRGHNHNHNQGWEDGQQQQQQQNQSGWEQQQSYGGGQQFGGNNFVDQPYGVGEYNNQFGSGGGLQPNTFGNTQMHNQGWVQESPNQFGNNFNQGGYGGGNNGW